jgi:hypothetical protein
MHKARSIQKLFVEIVEELDWPAQSPDFNSTEHQIKLPGPLVAFDKHNLFTVFSRPSGEHHGLILLGTFTDAILVLNQCNEEYHKATFRMSADGC